MNRPVLESFRQHHKRRSRHSCRYLSATDLLFARPQLLEPCRAAAKGARMIYNLAADIGSMDFIETHKAERLLSVLVSTKPALLRDYPLRIFISPFSNAGSSKTLV